MFAAEKTEVLDALSTMCYENSTLHGFWDDFETTCEVLAEYCKLSGDFGLLDKYILDTKLSKLALIMSELGEAVEGIRKPAPDSHCPEFTSEEIELADVLIRIFDYAGKFGLCLGRAVAAKHEYNISRPYMHGKKA